jgi:tripartite-type tricarboxylate transporter receptor subunit TctC
LATAASAGYDVNIQSWNAPARTPPPVIGPLNDALRAAIADAALARQMQAAGVDLPTPEHWRRPSCRT